MRTRDGNFIGRVRQQKELQQALDTAKSGAGGLILLSGEAGVGKTRLAEVCLTRSGCQVHMGTAIEEATAPYGPATAVLR